MSSFIPQPPSDGIYSNKLMVHSVMLLTVNTCLLIKYCAFTVMCFLQGHQVDVELIDSSIWTGILRTVSPEASLLLLLKT